MGKNQHVVKRDDGWAVRGEGNQRDTSHHNTQEQARQAAREIAINQRSEVVIHDRHGQIRAKDSYGTIRIRLMVDSYRAAYGRLCSY